MGNCLRIVNHINSGEIFGFASKKEDTSFIVAIKKEGSKVSCHVVKLNINNPIDMDGVTAEYGIQIQKFKSEAKAFAYIQRMFFWFGKGASKTLDLSMADTGFLMNMFYKAFVNEGKQ